ncbi:Uncharacterised protein [Salmonella enterica subsp. enterica serovar Bovismorbificans]|uniref:Uncharacterized protein n=1 Tax=Salmonella enterica subsp. enterica serovar Bovismorbificans TaxID=58097 RepID=A0A655DIB7_SALET|nr:Uncharacterised protein [Salmonella enterica subsp. enterica serovar Bovismorbificans]
MRRQPCRDHHFAVSRPQRMKHAIHKTQQKQRSARPLRMRRHRVKQRAQLLIHVPLPKSAFQHHLRPGLPHPQTANQHQQQE